MENYPEKDKIAMLTGTAIQDDETFKLKGGFVPERDQYYFQMQQGNNVFLVGSKELLICLKRWGNFLRSVINGGCRWQHFTEMIFLW